jgi:hypothetical protein
MTPPVFSKERHGRHGLGVSGLQAALQALAARTASDRIATRRLPRISAPARRCNSSLPIPPPNIAVAASAFGRVMPRFVRASTARPRSSKYRKEHSNAEVVPNARLVWTNEETEDGAVTTVTFEKKEGKTRLVMRELYPSKEALDVAIEGMDEAMPESFEQLDNFLIASGAGAEGS